MIIPHIPAELGDAQRLQADLLKIAEALKPNTGMGRAVRAIGLAAHRGAVNATHVDTGTLRASHIFTMQESGDTARGLVRMSEAAINWRTGQRAHLYGGIEHARGGSHAFYEIATHNAEALLEIGARALREELP